MTEVTGVIIARVEAMITVVTKTTLTVGRMTTKSDVTEIGIIVMDGVETIDPEMTGPEMTGPEETGLQEEMAIAVLHVLKERGAEMNVIEVEDHPVILAVHVPHEGLTTIVVEQKGGGSMKKTREDDMRRTNVERN